MDMPCANLPSIFISSMFEVAYEQSAALMLGHHRLISWEDQLHTHPAYIYAALAASRVCNQLYLQHESAFDDSCRSGSQYTTILPSDYRLVIVR